MFATRLFKKNIMTFLTVLEIAIGVMSVIVVSGIGSSGEKAVESKIKSLGINSIMINSNGEYRLNESFLSEVSDMPYVSKASPVVFGNANIDDEYNTECLMWGTDVKGESTLSFNILYGRNLNRADILNDLCVCLVDGNYAEKRFGRKNAVGKNITAYFGGEKKSFEIVGVVDLNNSLISNFTSEYIPETLFVPYTLFRLPTGDICFNYVTVEISEIAETSTVKKILLSRISDTMPQYSDVTVKNLGNQVDTIKTIGNTVTLILSLTAGISLVVSGISVMTIMLFFVNEKKREIGIKRAIGASKFIILCEFITKALYMTFSGSLLGIFSGVFINCVISRLLGQTFYFDVKTVLICLSVTVMSGIIFGIYPALKASKLNPADILRR